MSILEIAGIACATLGNTVVQSDVNLTLEGVNMNVSSLLLKNKEKKVLKAINKKYNEKSFKIMGGFKSKQRYFSSGNNNSRKL